ncbi:MAG TPA: ABC-F family ATP-binding cassette domain-containing protein [Gemmatimonadaceae bacterium]|nr:ABC-F family ATP-binding cassette domain-containing protein [Gemmatimonadaceae bacterium]
MTQLSLGGVAVEFGANRIFRDITFTVGKGDCWGIVGRNGTGKTTLLRLITGELAPTAGAVSRAPGLRVSLLEQHRDYGDAATIWEAAAGPFAELLALERSLADQANRIGELGERAPAELLERYGHDLERFEREGGYEIAPRVDAVLHGLGFDPADARTRALATLSGGERGRVGVARQLVVPADVLLLDEPTNHLDLETTRWLEEYLRALDATVILISHDRAFLDAVVDHVLHLEAETAVAYTGGFSAFVRQREERRLTQQRAFAQQRRVIAGEEDYIRRNIAGQNTRQAKGRRKRLARLPRLTPPPSEEDVMALRLEARERGGDQVLVAEGLDIGVADRVLIEGFTATIRRGEVVGLVGPNGAGKSTLLRAIIDDTAPRKGRIRPGSGITIAYYRQDLAQVPTDRTLYDIIADLRPRWERRQVQSHLARFGFPGDSAQRRADSLSGGERARVALAMMMLSGANLLLLDEPTNHLDVESIETLEDAIEGYGGTVLLVSHDRALLRSLIERVWVLHERRITDFAGTFEEWETVSAERAHAAAVAAAEEVGVRRVRERQKVRTRDDVSQRERARTKRDRETLAAMEAEIARLERRVAELTSALADPALYTTAEGTERAHTLGMELDAERETLDRLLVEWMERVEAGVGDDGPGTMKR